MGFINNCYMCLYVTLIIIKCTLAISDIICGASYLYDDCYISRLAIYIFVAGITCCLCMIIQFCEIIKLEFENVLTCQCNIKWYLYIVIECLIIWSSTYNKEVKNCSSMIFNYIHIRTIIIAYSLLIIFGLLIIYWSFQAIYKLINYLYTYRYRYHDDNDASTDRNNEVTVAV